jgi:hypothetical protein
MIRWFLTVLSALLVVMVAGLVMTPPVMAQSQTPDLTEAQVQQFNELRQKAFATTEKGDFPSAEGYWTQLIELLPENPVGWSNRGNSRVSQNKLEEGDR